MMKLVLFVKKTYVSNIVKKFRRVDKSYKKIIIVGGGRIGFILAQFLENNKNVTVIELNENRAEFISEKLKNTIVLKGNASDESLLMELGIENTDLFFALTNSDETNVIVSSLAKKLGAHKVITLVKKDIYMGLVSQDIDIDITISPDQITVGKILTNIRRGDTMVVHSLRHGQSEVMEVIVHGTKDTSYVVDRKIEQIKLPGSVYIACVIRDNKLIEPCHDCYILSGDHVIIMIYDSFKVHEVENLFIEFNNEV